jgi:hypothetical protein
LTNLFQKLQSALFKTISEALISQILNDSRSFFSRMKSTLFKTAFYFISPCLTNPKNYPLFFSAIQYSPSQKNLSID